MHKIMSGYGRSQYGRQKAYGRHSGYDTYNAEHMEFTLTPAQEDAKVRTFMMRTYSWMAAALVITAIVAFTTAQNLLLVELVGALWGLLAMVQLTIAFLFATFYQRVSSVVAGIFLVLYAVITGLFFSAILWTYSSTAIAATFITTAVTFGAMSALGLMLENELKNTERFWAFSLIGLFIALIVNLFMGSTILGFFISAFGIFIFSGLTVYETQRLRYIALYGLEGESAERAAIHGALGLYVNFVKIFLSLLRLGGREY